MPRNTVLMNLTFALLFPFVSLVHQLQRDTIHRRFKGNDCWQDAVFEVKV